MNKSTKFKAPVQIIFAGLILALVTGRLASTLYSAEPTTGTPAQTNSVEPKVGVTETNQAAVKPQLTGAELYSIHCNRCHPERYPTERTAAQWKTIMLHMQVRANIPVSQSKLILQYLQDNSGR